MTTKIEWTDATWNPTTGCNKVSEGCKNCYAEKMHPRLTALQPDKYSHKFLDGAFPHEPSLEIPLHWKKPRMVFVNSMSDLFHENLPFEFIGKVFGVMALCEQHTFQILTKRPERAAEFFQWLKSQNAGLFNVGEEWDANIYYQYIPGIINKYTDDAWSVGDSVALPLPNVWIGTSVENQQTADERIPQLLQIPAAVRFLSCEPLLGEVDISTYLDYGYGDPDGMKSNNIINWVICGGESGSKARPMHPDWARKLRNDCKAAGVPFFFKQWGEWYPFGQLNHNKPLSDSYKSLKEAINKCKSKNQTYFGARITSGPNGFMTGTTEGIRQEGIYKLGKKATGRLLDGIEHNEMPLTTATKSQNY